MKTPAPDMKQLARDALEKAKSGERGGEGIERKKVVGDKSVDEDDAEVDRRKDKPKSVTLALSTCSDVARRPLAQRLLMWRKRLKTANDVGALLTRYQAARRACELDDWRAEREFLRLMQRKVSSEAGARTVLRHLSSRPEVQRFVARLILRRVVDPRVVAAVERVLFGSAVDWNSVDLKLTELEEPAARIDELRTVMARSPNDPNGQIRLVEQLALADRASEALTLGRRLRDRGLLTLRMARKLGDVLARQKLDEEAVRTYSEIVEFDPSSLASRSLLGDIYLGHGWYEPAYRQYKTVTDAAPDNALGWLRLAAAAAGSGRIDEALRLERKVATAQGRPGPNDPRRWARLWSAARLARLIAEPPKGKNAPSRASVERKLKELGLFASGAGTLVVLTWEDLGDNLLLVTRVDEQAAALGEQTDAAAAGLSAALLSKADRGRAQLVARLRSVPRQDPIALVLHEITWDGKKFAVQLKRLELAAGETLIEL
jgi:tetratricopeptide (TPR) repeat protein